MWPQVAYAVVMMIISYAIQSLLTPPPKNPEAGKMDVPLAQEGDPIPVIFGTVVLKTPNVVWYGDAATSEIQSSGGKK